MVVASLFAAGAIVFGASEAMASNAAFACMVNPPTELGECVTPEGSCDARCKAIGGPEATGVCSGDENCCGCFL
jgi:hypothetical protein